MATNGLFRREPLLGEELDVDSALDRGLALVIEIPLDEDGRSVRPPTLAELLGAASRMRSDAFEARLMAEQFGAAEILLDTVTGPGDDFDVEAARVRLATAEREALSRVSQDYNALFDVFASARARGRIDEASAPVLHSKLLGARPVGPDVVQRRDLGALRGDLTTIAEDLQEAIIQRRDAVRTDIESAFRDGRISSEWAARLRGLLEREELGAAEEYLYRAQAGDDPPDERHEDLEAKLLTRALAALGTLGLDESLVEAARKGTTVRELDFSAVPEIDRDAIASALSAWIDLHAEDRRQRWQELLKPVLRLLGIVSTTIDSPQSLRSMNTAARRFVDVAGESSGTAFVPSFGSRAQGRRRMMLSYEPMSASQMWDTAVSGAMPDQPVYVLHVGTLSTESRLALAREARNRGTGQVVVIDDAVILACALAGRQAYDVTMRAVLPYAAVNPFNPDLPGEIPEEMFYGRQSELDSIANLTGASFVSGGRRFGKTALLHSVRKIYARPQSNVLTLFVVIQHVAADPQQSASDLWPLLARRLSELKVLDSSVSPDAEGVCSALRRWLAENTEQRLLLLLDECDLFLRADAEGGFRNVAELRNLMADFGGQFKVVFSGLQHVARYLKLPNQPLSQLPPPVVIGPLDPSSACELIRRPLEALGFAPSDAQIDRLVTYCACNPSVVQLAGMQLVERLRNQPVAGLAPWSIDDRLLNQLLDSAELASGVRDRLFLTLNLDHRYKLLAYLVAFRAINDGLGTVASPTELRTLAFDYWPDGFSSQRPDDIRALCDELVGLGVFAGDADSGYRMLSPAAVRLLGTADEIESELTTAYETYVPDMAVGAAGSRPRIEDTRFSPLVASQLADVVGQGRTQLRIVIGSKALCVDDVPAALRVAADRMPNVSVTEVTRLRDWRELMTAPAGGHRIVVHNGTLDSLASFEESINDARRRGSTRSERGTRSAVLVVGPNNREVLRRLVVTPGSSRVADLADVTVALGRVDLDSLRAWARIEELDVVLPAQLTRLLEVTGGWPILIERLLKESRTTSFDAAADSMVVHLATVEGAREILADLGLEAGNPDQSIDRGVLAVLRALVRHDLEGDPETLVALLSDDVLAEESDPAEALAVLQAIGVLETRDGGDVAVEQLVCRSLALVDSDFSEVAKPTD
jgi:BMFP domain-containing protein YqiC